MAVSKIIRCGSLQFNIRNITVEPVLFLYFFAAYIVIPTLQALAYHKVCIQKYNVSFCSQLQNVTFQKEHAEESDYVQTETSHLILLANIAMTIPACFTVFCFLGSFGDKVGRKFPILLPTIGAIIQAFAGLLNAAFPSSSVYFLLIGPAISGLCGGIIAAVMAVYSYIAHIATTESKTMRIGIVESMGFLAGTLGVFLSGLMLDRTSFEFVFGFTMALLLLATVYIVFWLEEIRPSQTVNIRNICGRWILENVKESVNFITKRRPPRVRCTIFLLIISINLILLCTIGEFDIILLFLRREPLVWSQSMFGYFKGAENLLKGLMLVVVLPVLKKKLHVRDTAIVMGGAMSKVAGLIILGIATKTWIVFIAGIIGMAQGLPSAGLRSMMSSLVKDDEQGRLFGIVATAESLIGILAALLFNTIYPLTLHLFAGTCFLMAAGISFVSFCIVLYLHKSGVAEMCHPPPYRNMPEEADAEEFKDEDVFHVAIMADEDHFAYI